MKPYAKYKLSGVSWLGDVPEHWEVKRIRFLARLNPRATRKLDPAEKVSFLPMEAVGDDGSLKLEQTRHVEEVSTGYTYFEDGDVTVAKITPCFENGKGANMQGLTGGVGFGTTELIVIRPSEAVHPQWLYLLTQTTLFRKRGEALMQGSGGQKRVPDSYIKDFPVAWPSDVEQEAIAAYLDTETARIDTLVTEKEELLELLSEARISTITGLLVGAGLPGVPSGNPWVPHLPKGWQLKRLKHLADVRSGLAKGKDYGGKPTVEMPYLRVANVQDGHLNLSDVSMIEVAADEAERFLLQSGDVLMNEGGDFDKLGRGAVWSGEVSPCLHQNHVFAVRPYEKDVSEWLAATTQTMNAKFYFKSNAKQSTNLASISQTDIKELPVLLPPPDERLLLLSQLRTEVSKIDGLITHVQKEIELLKELRSATITDAVLGRIDLREYAKKAKRGEKSGELQPAL